VGFMQIALIHGAKLPVQAYGGTERVVWWLAKGLSELGVDVTLVCSPGSTCPFATVTTSIPPSIDLEHHFCTPSQLPQKPYLVTIEGNGKVGETFLPNTAFVSRNHAVRHGAECFVYNGLDPDDYSFREKKDDYLLFLAKASWQVKNVKGAIRIARKTGHALRIVGGSRWYRSWRSVHWQGMLGGEEKAKWIAGARGLLFPVLWNEPFGLAVVEAMLSGTPVLASPHGSLPELVGKPAGHICHSEKEMQEWVGRLGEFSATECRDWAVDNFHFRVMAKNYVALYERILKGEKINKAAPHSTEPPQKLMPLA